MGLATHGERKPFAVVQTAFDDIEGQLSPDGQWLADASNESGRYDIYVRTVPESGGKWQVSVAGGAQPRWRGDWARAAVAADGRFLMNSAADEAIRSPITIVHRAWGLGLEPPVPSPQSQVPGPKSF